VFIIVGANPTGPSMETYKLMIDGEVTELTEDEVIRRLFAIENRFLGTPQWEDIGFLLELNNLLFTKLKDIPR
jgi:hypothetical protein